MNKESKQENKLEIFKSKLCTIRGAKKLKESDKELILMMGKDWNEVFAKEVLAKKVRRKKQTAQLVPSPVTQGKQRQNNIFTVLSWLSVHRCSNVKILQYALSMESLQGARNVCDYLEEVGLISWFRPPKVNYHLYAITDDGLEAYYDMLDDVPELCLKRASRFRKDRIPGNLEHDEFVQWARIDLRSKEVMEPHRQQWLGEPNMPGFTGFGQHKKSKESAKFPDGILVHSPYSWRSEYDNPPGYGRLNTINDTEVFYNSLSNRHWLDKTGVPGDDGYLTLAIEVERTLKGPKEYKKRIIQAHETRIKKGLYHAVLYLFETDRKADNARIRFNEFLEAIYPEKPHALNDYGESKITPRWVIARRKFIFDSYIKLVPDAKKSKVKQKEYVDTGSAPADLFE